MPRGFPPADIFTAQTPDGGPDGPTDQLCVRAVLAQGSCAYCAGHRHFCARTHTRVRFVLLLFLQKQNLSRERLPSRELPLPPAERSPVPPATGVEMAFDLENLPTVPTDSALFFSVPIRLSL